MKKLLRRYDILFIIVLFILSIPAEYSEIFSLLEDQTISFRHIIRNNLGDKQKTAFLYNKIVLVTVDDLFFEEYNSFPLKRNDIAKIITNLKALGANVIGLDMFMKFASSYDEDPILAQSLHEAGNTVLASQAVFEDDRFIRIIYPAPLLNASSSNGYVNFTCPGSVAPLLSRLRIYPEITRWKDGWYFTIQVLARYLNVSPRIENRFLILGDMRIPLDQSDDIYIDFPFIPKGYKFIHQVAGISALEFLDISDLDEDELQELEIWVKDKIVLLGDTTEVSSDWFDTPVGQVYGIEILADTINTILKGAPLRPASLLVEILTSFLFLSLIICCCLIIQQPGFRTWIVIAVFIGYIVCCTLAYVCLDTVLSMSYSLTIGLLGYFSMTLHAYVQERKLRNEIDARRKFVRNVFGRYLSDEIVQTLLDTPGGLLSLGGENRLVTVMMTVLRGFTAIGERLSPEGVVAILNNYFEKMTRIIDKHQGTISKFMGDAILGIFGAPLSHKNDARHAVACAVEMQLEMDKVNEWNQDHGYPAIEMGIGLHTGDVVVGNIGSEKRSQYDIIGKTVNHAARIESYSVGGQIYISKETRKAVGDDLRIDSETVVLPKGIKSPFTIYETGGIGGEYNLFLPKKAEIFFNLSENLPVSVAVLSGKHASSETTPGKIVRVATSLKKAEIQGDITVENLDNLKLSFLDENRNVLMGDIYGKVTKVSDECGFIVTFTFIPDEAEHFLSQALPA